MADIYHRLADIQDELTELGLYQPAFYLGVTSVSISMSLDTPELRAYDNPQEACIQN